MNCKNCKREMNQNDEFCGGCGSKLIVSPVTEQNSCPSCMNEISIDQTHCQKCGSSRNVFKDEQPAEVSTGASKSSKLLGIIFTIIGLAVIIFAFINYKNTEEALRTDNNPGLGLQYIMSFPIGIVGLIILIAGLSSLNKSANKS